MRIVGIDFGEKRIGVAAAESRTRIAIPVTTVTVNGDPVATIAGIAAEERADELVLGMPLSLTGAEGPQAQRVRQVMDELSQRLSIPVRCYDERLTTAQANRALRGAGGGRKGRASASGGSSGRDAAAAAIMLQAYLDSQRPYG